MVDAYANQPVVIDNGTGLMKTGFAGTENPSLIFSNYVGRPKHYRAMASAVDGDYFIGDKANDLRGLLRHNYPMEHGVVTNWEDMQNVWQYCYQQLHCQTEEHPVLLTEAPLNPRKNRSKAAEVFFERFSSPALYVAAQAILSLYASGRTTGIVLDSGDGVTHAVPLFEGFALPHAITRMNVAGRDITEHLKLLLMKNGYNLHTTAEFETIRDIKEKLCLVAFNIEKSERESADDVEPETAYRLPDGKTVSLGAEKFRAPEILFNPSLIGLEYEGVHKMLVNSIEKSDMDLRRTLFSQILLSGGNTLFPGFGDRLLSEVRKIAPRDTKIRIFAPQERILSTWIGGSILASLATFKKMWVTKKEYEEEGQRVLFRRAL